MSGSYYDTARICKNGHVITSMANDSLAGNQKYCDQCGEETVTSCGACNAKIHGYYNVPGVIGFYDYSAPAYCYNCGKPYSWTARRLEAANDLADELEGISDEEKEKLKASFPDLVRDGPKTVVAETRFKKIMKKVGGDAYEGMRSILVDVVSETVKKSLFGA